MSDCIKREDPAFPDLLRQISGCPKKLWFRGNLDALKVPGVAVVGSRACTPYGARIASKIGERSVDFECAVVSGMAQGIDSAALWGAAQAGGIPIAVFGGGVDVCYPRENRPLMNKIEEMGIIISEHPDGTEPKPRFLAARNRIISGLCEVVVVVEAAFRSGSLKTAEFAHDQNRHVMAVPGSIFSNMSVGTNQLIRDRVDVVTVPDDPFRYVGTCGGRVPKNLPAMDEDERLLYEHLRDAGELTPEELVRMTSFSPSKVLNILSIMEMKGIVVNYMGRVFLASI